MRRLVTFALVLAGVAALCLGQYRPRSRAAMRRIVQLTEARTTGSVSLEEALAKRRSVRVFTNQPITPAQISQLVWAGQGITEPQRGLRTAPSAGELYPIELYLAMPDGLFVYQPDRHSLEELTNEDLRGQLAQAAGQDSAGAAACDIIVAGSVRKLAGQFREKARTYMLLEAGHVAQNILLQAVCLELGAVPIGGFDTKGVTRICNLPRGAEPIYIISVGHPAAEESGVGSGQNAAAQGRSGAGPKRALLVVGSDGFRDEELFETGRVLEVGGVETVVASNRTGIIRGVLGGVVEVRLVLDEVIVDDFDAIVFVGGPGAAEYFEDPVAINIAREAAHKGKVLGAISIAPAILANAGVLRGVQATSIVTERPRLAQAGAILSDAMVERDRLVVTADGPLASRTFGRAIVDALAGR